MRRFFIGFCSGLALFVVLNAAPYFLASAPQLRTLGILSPFWRQDPTYLTRVFVPSQSGAHVEPQFYWDKFGINLAIALMASFSFGRWLQQRGENKTSNDNVA